MYVARLSNCIQTYFGNTPSSRLLPGPPLPLYSPWLSLRLSAGDHQVYLSTVTYTPHQIPSFSSIHIYYNGRIKNAKSYSTHPGLLDINQHMKEWHPRAAALLLIPVCHLIYCRKFHDWIILTLHIASSLLTCWAQPKDYNVGPQHFGVASTFWGPQPWNSFLICTIGVSKLTTLCTKHENYPKMWS
jgi:hypothetical protein